jgi:hypothetical protein
MLRYNKPLSTLLVAGLATLALVSSPAARAQTVVGSLFHLHTKADIGNNVINVYDDSQGSTLNPYSGSISSTDTIGSDSVSAFASGSATFFSAASGSSTFDMGWTSNNSNFPYGLEVGDFTNNWAYTFTATGDGILTLSYDITASGSLIFGLQGFTINWDGPGGGLYTGTVFDPTASGVFTSQVFAGNTYTIGLSEGGNVFSDTGPGGVFDGSMHGQFDWDISGQSVVPEGSSFTLLLSGLATTGMGVVIRRRRRA